MDEQNQFDWVDFYREFAVKLLAYKNKGRELVEKVRAIYTMTGINMPTLEKDNELVDIDPFTVLGLFNKKVTENKRIKITQAIVRLFDVKTQVPTPFDSLPVLSLQNATFYYFIDQRGQEGIDGLWELFASALAYAEAPTDQSREIFSRYFDLVMNKKGSGNSKITVALYWISPDTFLNLDRRNRWYIYESGKLPEDVVEKLPKMYPKLPASKYFEIIGVVGSYLQSEGSALKDFKELSSQAWVASKVVDPQDNGDKKRSKAAFLRWLGPLIQALRDLGGPASPAKAREKIIEDENLSEEEVNETRGKNKVNKSANKVAFAWNYLANTDYIDRSLYRIWTLTEKGKTVNMTRKMASDIFKNVLSSSSDKAENRSTALADQDAHTVCYWIYAPGKGSCRWEGFYDEGIMVIGWGELGDPTQFESEDVMRAKTKKIFDENLTYVNLAYLTWQFANEMKIGDIVFVKRGIHQLIGRGVVTSDYEFDTSREDNFKNICQVDWTHIGEWPHLGQTVTKTLTNITSYTDYVEKPNTIFEDESEEDVEEVEKIYPTYTKENFLSEVYISEEEYDKLAGILRIRRNVVPQGAPGVGKTFAAKRLAFSMMGVKDVERVMMVQFHQSYSYKDFIMGFRPSSSGFELKRGAFYNFCKKVEIGEENDYFFIIDEINRGNLSKIFGELFMLIENDKRGIPLQLLYSDEKFSVPKSIHIIGMMNTADRSLAMLDYASRGRFAFFGIKPGFTTGGSKKYVAGLENEKFDRLIARVENLDDVISEGESLGKGFCIGHSYFYNLSPSTLDALVLSGIVEYELVPLLKEYWFGEPTRVTTWTSNLRSVLK